MLAIEVYSALRLKFHVKMKRLVENMEYEKDEALLTRIDLRRVRFKMREGIK